MLRERGKSFSKSTVYLITAQLLDRLQTLHQIGYIHADLKLENICIGLKDLHKIYLIDFGLSKRWRNEDGQHIKFEHIDRFSGNVKFASLNSCKGFRLSRRDDIMSLMYMMIYLLNNCKLPWNLPNHISTLDAVRMRI